MRTNYATLSTILGNGGTKGAVNMNLEKEFQKVVALFQAIASEVNRDKKINN